MEEETLGACRLIKMLIELLLCARRTDRTDIRNRGSNKGRVIGNSAALLFTYS